MGRLFEIDLEGRPDLSWHVRSMIDRVVNQKVKERPVAGSCSQGGWSWLHDIPASFCLFTSRKLAGISSRRPLTLAGLKLR